VLILSVLASSVLLVLALPPVGLHWLAWFALTPALVAAEGRGFWRGFGIGLGMLAVASLVSRSGVFFHPSLLGGESGWNFASFGVFGVAVGLTFGVWGRASEMQPWVLAAWSVLFESLLLLYLPGHLALTQSRVPTMLALASVTGIWGVICCGSRISRLPGHGSTVVCVRCCCLAASWPLRLGWGSWSGSRRLGVSRLRRFRPLVQISGR
jgi:hypothetical protein